MVKYNPQKDGAVVAVRIFEDGGSLFPKAEMAFAFGGTEIIEWTNSEQRTPFLRGMNGYTFIFDERQKHNFNHYVKEKQ